MPTSIRKLFVVFFLTGLCATDLQAQVGEVRTKSQSNQGQHGGRSGGGGGTSISPGSSEDLAAGCLDLATSACAQQCCNIAMSFMANIWDHHQNLLKTKQANPEIIRLEIMPQAAYNPFGVISLLPRVRGQWGLFGTDIRLTHLAETLTDTPYTYNALDWSILQFNVIATRHFFMRIGSGIMTERTDLQGIFYNEHFLGMDIHWTNLISTNLEGRIAFDYITQAIPRWEINGRVNCRLMRYGNFHVFGTLGVLYQNYYSGTGQFLSPQTGLLITLK